MKLALALAAVTAACLAPIAYHAIQRRYREAQARIALIGDPFRGPRQQVIGICFGCQTNSSPDWSAFCDTCRPPVATIHAESIQAQDGAA
jgi:hypothetical protein